MSQDTVTTRSRWLNAFTGVAGRFYAGMAFGILALIALTIYGSMTISSVLLERKHSALPKDSVANVSQIVTLDCTTLTERIAKLPARSMAAIDAGLRLVLDL